jgi:predicted HicB family RNase H-like nuclease
MIGEIYMENFEYEGYVGTVNYDKKCDYYTGEVEIDGRLYTYEGDSLEELREDFEDIIDSIIAFEDMEGEEEEEE